MTEQFPDDIEGFRDRVYHVTRQIPEGRVATYGDIALLAGSPRAARAVGQALNRLLGQKTDVPWHRVINSKGRISIKGDMARARRQKRMLRHEGVDMVEWGCDLESHRWEPDRLFWSDRSPNDMHAGES